jgi:type VI protein secretion system component VasK
MSLSAVVSTVYFMKSPTSTSLGRRCLVSAHGLSIVAIYLIGLTVLASDSHPDLTIWQRAIFGSLVVPVALVCVSLKLYEGPKMIHALQVVNVVNVLLVAFLTFMVPALT